MNKAQQKALKLAKDAVVTTLEAATNADQFADVFTLVYGALDADGLTVDGLMEDPTVKAALRKFVSKVVGAVQFTAEGQA